MMESMLADILEALGQGALAGAKDTLKGAMKDAYEGLKGLIIGRYGSEAKVEEAIQELEEEPDSQGKQIVLKEQLAKTGAPEDPKLAEQARAFLQLLEQSGLKAGSVYQAKLTGRGAIAQGSGAVAAGAGGVAIDGNVEGNISTGGAARDEETDE